MTENIITAILILATFIVLLILLISNFFMRKKSGQPTLRELEKQYKNLEMNESKREFQTEVLSIVAFRPAVTSALMIAVVSILVVSPEVMTIINNGPNPCDVKEIKFNHNANCPLEITGNDFWSCI